MHDQPSRRRRVSFRRLALGALVTGAVMAVPVSAHASSDVMVFAPFNGSVSTLDQPIRFSWYPENSQDFFRVVFSQTPSGGWEDSPHRTNETVLDSAYVSPRDVGLTPGTWYWRICYGWNTDARHICYWDDDIRTLDVRPSLLTPLPPVVVPPISTVPPVSSPPPVTSTPAVQLTVSEGKKLVYDGLKRTFKSRYPGPRGVAVGYTRVSATTIRYRVSWKKRGAKYTGTVKVNKTSTQYTYTVDVRRR